MNITLQPEANVILGARSPIMYKIEGCSTGSTFTITPYFSTTSTAALAEYITITRTPDLDQNIIININNLTYNYLRKNINFPTSNTIVYQMIRVKEYVDGTLVNTLDSNITLSTDGYSDYYDNINYGYTDPIGAYYSTTNLCEDGNVIELPVNNLSGDTYFLNFRNAADLNLLLSFTDSIYQSGNTFRYPSTSITDCISNIMSFQIDYNYLKTQSNIDITKDIRIDIESGIDIIKTYILRGIKCSGNDIHCLKYLNKYGIIEKIYINGRVDEKIEVTSEQYKYNNVNYTDFTYSKTGSYHNLYVNGKKSYTLNTGWVNDRNNKKYEQLFMSEYLTYDDIPVFITDKNFTFKTVNFDKYINYTINIQEAFDKINNIN